MVIGAEIRHLVDRGNELGTGCIKSVRVYWEVNMDETWIWIGEFGEREDGIMG